MANQVFAFDANDGTPVWERTLGTPITGGGLGCGFGAQCGIVRSRDAVTGHEDRHETRNPIGVRALPQRDSVLVATMDQAAIGGRA